MVHRVANYYRPVTVPWRHVFIPVLIRTYKYSEYNVFGILVPGSPGRPFGSSNVG